MKHNKKVLGNKFSFDFSKEQKAWEKASKSGDYSDWCNQFIMEHEDVFNNGVLRNDFCHYLKSRKKAVGCDNVCNTTVLYPLLLGFTMSSLSFKLSEDMSVQLQNFGVMIGFLVLATFSSIAIIRTIYQVHLRNEFIEDILSIFSNSGSEETK